MTPNYFVMQWPVNHTTVTLSIIIPCFNEAENIVAAVQMVINGIDDSVVDYEIILVDDGSTDSSREIIHTLAVTESRIRALFHQQNLGKGAALHSGFDQARMTWVLTMDADLQIDIAELKLFLPFCTDYDVITGVRNGRNEGFVRFVVSKIYNFLVSVVTGTRIQDVGCPFKLMKAAMVKTVPLSSQGFAVDAEIFQYIAAQHHRIKEVSVQCHPRLKGESKVTLRRLFITLFDLIKLAVRRA